MLRILYIIVFLLTALSLLAQGKISVDKTSNAPPSQTSQTVRIELPSEQMEAVVASVQDMIGFPEGDFSLMSTSDVLNVQATIAQSRKYILYNPAFVDRYIKTGKTNALKVLIAHEIAHLTIHAVKLGELNIAKRIEMEYEADAFAATLLTQLGVPESEILQILKDLPDYSGSVFHPSKSDRIKKIQEIYAGVRETGVTTSVSDWPANYLLSPYMFNRWNLLSKKYKHDEVLINVVGNKEIRIEYDITDVYKHKRIPTVCLKEYNHSRGGVSNFQLDTIQGSGGRKGTIRWFYPEDKYSNRDIRSAKLSVLIYDPRHTPKEPPVIKGVLWGVIGAGGVGLLTQGGLLQWSAQKDYHTYSTYRNPNESIYTDLGMTRAQLFDHAQKVNLESQIWLAGGAVVSAVAIPALIKHIRRAKRTDENKMCCGY